MSSLTIFKNGFYTEFDKRSISMGERENGDVRLEFKFETEDANFPACSHEVIDGKRVTNINLTAEAMERLVQSYILYKRS